MYAVTVEFTIDPTRWDDFIPLMLENAERSRSDEPGCRQFDVCTDAMRPSLVFLHELYDDAAAFDAHLASPHYRSFAAATKAMVTNRAIGRWERRAG
jgi:(4S)-4-hydroxy-5-phosphonooxypentane-2,3-dione isomerase